MDILFGTVGFFIQIIFMFKREWLFEKRSFTLIFIVSAALFVLSYILMLNHIGNPKDDDYSTFSSINVLCR
jgi:hypothetical protein